MFCVLGPNFPTNLIVTLHTPLEYSEKRASSGFARGPNSVLCRILRLQPSRIILFFFGGYRLQRRRGVRCKERLWPFISYPRNGTVSFACLHVGLCDCAIRSLFRCAFQSHSYGFTYSFHPIGHLHPNPFTEEGMNMTLYSAVSPDPFQTPSPSLASGILYPTIVRNRRGTGTIARCVFCLPVDNDDSGCCTGG